MMGKDNRPTPYETVGDYLDAWIKNEYGCYGMFIVGIYMKYDHEKEFEHFNVVVTIDGSEVIWDYDWWEGQQEVHVKGIIPVDEVKNYAYDTNAGGKNFYVKGGE